MKRILTLLLLGLGLGVSPLLAEEVRFNLWPFFFYARSQEATRLELVGPFIYRYRNGKESSLSFRPLFAWVNHPSPGERDLYFLSPLGHYHAEGTYRHFRLVPLISYDWKVEEEKGGQGQAKSRTLFPIFWGRTAEGETYGGIFPIYGVFKKRFGYDEVRFVLWPLYSFTRLGEDRSTNILWPIFNYSRGPTLSGFKF